MLHAPGIYSIVRWGVSLAAGLVITAGALAGDPLPGTQPLELAQPLDVEMVAGIDRFALRELADSPNRRAALWTRDFSSRDAYEKSIEANRQRLRTYIGATDPRPAATGLELISTTSQDAFVARGKDYNVLSVRWPVLQGVYAEGLLLQPVQPPIARVIAIPDADWTPEQFAGLAAGVDPASQLARRLVEQRCQVLMFTLVNRDDAFSGHPDVRYTNQTHREWIYRQAFEMGRHVIGYEVQKVLAGVDQLADLNKRRMTSLPIGVAGVGEGGLLALHAAALDPRIEAVLVSGYFEPREAVWEEPIYRNVWAQLTEFGDAEIAGMIAPRPLVIEAAAVPESAGPPAVKEGRSGGAAPGRIRSPKLADVQREFARLQPVYQQLQAADKAVVVTSGPEGTGPSGSDAALAPLLAGLKVTAPIKPSLPALKDARTEFNPVERQRRTVSELVDFTQALLNRSARVRSQLWSKADHSSLAGWEATAEFYRNMVYDELIGRLPAPTMPLNPRTRQILDEPELVGYEVVLDVFPDVIAGGILLLPKDLQPGEQRPVVVCQHGLEGVPMDTISKSVDGYKYYKAFAAELCRRGFITYAPQNPYRGHDLFRTLQRKSNPLRRSLFSYIIPQHERTLEFLKSLPGVDPNRIGFYGLSYGGKTAVRVPPMVKGYALSICSADFNEWVRKNTTVHDGYSYVFTPEYEIFEWNMGHVANYAELSWLMTPRPFMVERGHDDGVAPDEWVAWEFSKVKQHYDRVGLGDRTEIEFFNGPHTINGVATFEFLHRHLNWPKRP